MKHSTVDEAIEFLEEWNDCCYNFLRKCHEGECKLDLDDDCPKCYDTLMKIRALVRKYWDLEYPHKIVTPIAGKE